MKKSTEMILKHFPILENHINDSGSAVLRDSILTELNSTERTFLCLAWFFENPDIESFNLETLYKNLDNDWLSIALELIVYFFANDTYLINEPTFSLVTEKSEYLNQANFTKFLNEHKNVHGKNFSRAMLNSYLNRGIIPEPDLELAGTKYWLKETCEEYLSSLSDSFHEREKNKK